MRLLLDEQLSPSIAGALRDRGHDVHAVAGDPVLAGTSDLALLRRARTVGRALVTQDVGDFHRISRQMAATGEAHAGVVMVSRASFPSSTTGIGRLVRALHHLLLAHSTEDALADRVVWLEPVPESD